MSQPMIARRAAALAPTLVFEPIVDDGTVSRLMDDLKMFTVTWLAGLVFFGTYLS